MNKLIAGSGVAILGTFSYFATKGIVAMGGIKEALVSYAAALAPMETMVQSYSSLKGVEYLVVLAFLVAFICFNEYLNAGSGEETIQIKALA